MSGALIQLMTGENNSMNIITHPCENIRFNSNNTFRISRQCDVIKSIYFKFKMLPLPVGYTYKNCWTQHAFEHIELVIGGQRIWQTNKEKERMLHLILPLNTNRDLIFDYNSEERQILSANIHETIFELNIKEIFGANGIPLIALLYHDVIVNFTLGAFENCVERNENIQTILDSSINYMVECLPQSIGLFLNGNHSTNLAQTPSETYTKNYDIATTIVNSSETKFNMIQDGVCVAAYIHITNEDGSEIQNQVIDNIKVLLNNYERFNISGFQAKHMMRTLLPHATQDNNKSQNLYYISYYSETYGQTPIQSNFENGLNASRIDSHKFEFSYNSNIPPRLKISIIHKNQNIFRVANGISGYAYGFNSSSILTDTELHEERLRRIAAMPPPILGAVYTPRRSNKLLPNSRIIPIPSDDNYCIITLDLISENEDVVQCMQCKKICNMDALNSWFVQSTTCPHCRGGVNTITFLCGKAQTICN